jgi:hypothetical protein
MNGLTYLVLFSVLFWIDAAVALALGLFPELASLSVYGGIGLVCMFVASVLAGTFVGFAMGVWSSRTTPLGKSLFMLTTLIFAATLLPITWVLSVLTSCLFRDSCP